MEKKPGEDFLERNRDSRKHFYAFYKDDFYPSDKTNFTQLTKEEEKSIEMNSKETIEKLKKKYKYFDYIPELSAVNSSASTMTKLVMSNMFNIGMVFFPLYWTKRKQRLGYHPSPRSIRRDYYFYFAALLFYGYFKATLESSQQEFFKTGMKPLAQEERILIKLDERYSHFRHIDPLIEERNRYTKKDISEAKDIAHWVLAEKVEKIRNSSNTVF